jgi:hypothetical protein
MIESSRATVRHRTDRTQGCLTHDGIEVQNVVHINRKNQPGKVAA